MTSNPPKGTHYIPRLLLSNFVDSAGFLHMFDRKGQKYFSLKPGNAFIENHLTRMYDFSSDDYSYEAEEILSQIEGRAAPVIKTIIESARTNEIPQLSQEERDDWKRFYHAMCRRTPEFSEEMLTHDERFDDIYHLVLERLLRQQGVDSPERGFFDKHPMLTEAKLRIKKNNKSRFASGDHPHLQSDVEHFCQDTGLRIAVIHRLPRRSFVIGSHGVSVVRQSHKNDRMYGGWLPIANDVVVAPTSQPKKDLLLRLDDKKDSVIRRINITSFQQSRFIATESEALIRSLKRR